MSAGGPKAGGVTTDILIGAAAIGGLIWWLVTGAESESDGPAVACGPSGCTVRLRFRSDAPAAYSAGAGALAGSGSVEAAADSVAGTSARMPASRSMAMSASTSGLPVVSSLSP